MNISARNCSSTTQTTSCQGSTGKDSRNAVTPTPRIVPTRRWTPFSIRAPWPGEASGATAATWAQYGKGSPEARPIAPATSAATK